MEVPSLDAFLRLKMQDANQPGGSQERDPPANHHLRTSGHRMEPHCPTPCAIDKAMKYRRKESSRLLQATTNHGLAAFFQARVAYHDYLQRCVVAAGRGAAE